MGKFIKSLLVAVMAISLIGCGDDDQEKAEDLKKEFDRLVSEVNSAGTPSVSWSEEDLNSFIAKLNRIEAIERESHSNDSFVVYGYNQSAVDTLRDQARQALSSKRAQATTSGSSSGLVLVSSIRTKVESAQRKIQEAKALLGSRELGELGDEELAKLVEITSASIEDYSQAESDLVTLRSEHPDRVSSASFTDIKERIRSQKVLVKSIKIDAELERANRRAQRLNSGAGSAASA